MTESIAPSSLWHGTPVEGSRWTYQQIQVLMKEGRDPVLVPTATILLRPRVNPDDWTMPPKVEAIVLPRLAIARNGKRAKIITPAGATQWLDIQHG